MNVGSGKSLLLKKKIVPKMGRTKEAEVRHGVALVRKGRKGNRWLR